MRTPIPLFAAVVLTGCARTPQLPAVDALRPELTYERLEVTGLGFGQVDANLVFTLHNPYASPIEMTRLGWTLELAETQILTGDGPGATLPPETTATLPVPVSIAWSEILPALASLGDRDELPWTVEGQASFATPLGTIRVPYAGQGTLPALHAPHVAIRRLSLRGLDLRNAFASVDLVLELHSAQPLAVRRLEYVLAVDGERVAEGITDMGDLGDTLVLTTELDLEELGEPLLDTFATQGAVDVHLVGTAEVETPHGTVPLEVDVRDLVAIEDRGRL